jgi:hypothetical protein
LIFCHDFYIKAMKLHEYYTKGADFKSLNRR